MSDVLTLIAGGVAVCVVLENAAVVLLVVAVMGAVSIVAGDQ
jgi:hypothetical protein